MLDTMTRVLSATVLAGACVVGLRGVAGCGDAGTRPPEAETDPMQPEGTLGSDDAAVGPDDAGVGPDDASTTDGPPRAARDTAAPLSLEGLTVTENPANLLSVFVAWTTPVDATTELAVTCSDGFRASYGSDALSATHEVFVMGLVAESDCDLVATSSSSAGRTGEARAEHRVSELPTFLPEFWLPIAELDRMQPGWTLFNLTNQVDDEPLLVVMVDEVGRYRWYYRNPGPGPGDATEVRRMPEGVLIGESGREVTSLVSWEGEALWEADLHQHHDIRPFGEDRLLYLAYDLTDGDASDTLLGLSETLQIYDLGEERTVWRWTHTDHYLAVDLFPDWLHLNAVEPVPGENAVITSSRNQNALFKVNLDTERIEWIMGTPPSAYEPADIPRFTFVDDDPFYEQHAPEIQPGGGSILLFDNGSMERPYSRVVEIGFDEASLEASVVWQFTLDPPRWHQQWGDADRLVNDNVLSAWGARQYGSRIVEATRAKEIVWELAFPERWGLYRADRIVDPPTGHVR